jgi:hypothetical protein
MIFVYPTMQLTYSVIKCFVYAIQPQLMGGKAKFVIERAESFKFLLHRIKLRLYTGRIKKNSNPGCYAPSSEHFSVDLLKTHFALESNLDQSNPVCR